ncbi:EF-P 5-aminopentanol modification-associated protein YfmF [Mesobacillus zeae]|uniref:Insulinase family protein n=1 Tax=Mesobacillus zeae TaxID=1917180 RepID=A0A398BJY8_9BACI|nr:pitrilysin family protein [Mesobacillus zeae]RID88060.1 insulinase family protein [Mesobacillus zeae]
MGVISQSVKDMNGFKLHVVKTGKFKTNTIVWRMKAPLQKETATKRALLPYVLQSSSRKFPDTTVLRSYLDELYGASLYVDVAKKGEYQVLSFTLDIANEKFLGDPEPLLRKGMELLAEILVNPLAESGSFDRSTVEKEKRTLEQRIHSVYDDKMRYAGFRLIQEMCKDEPYALHVNGDLEDVALIDESSLYEYYKQAFSNDEMDLYVIGDVTEAEVEEAAASMLSFNSRIPEKKEMNSPAPEAEKVVTEEQDIKQGKLNIGCRTNILYGEKDYAALQVFNGIFGGFSHSKLFLNVREKESLAYYAASRLESHKGLMMVMAGIETANYKRAVTIIKEQLDEMRNGQFTSEEIQQTILVIENQMLETMDTARGLVDILYHNVIAESQSSVDEWLSGMKAVTREDIIAVANKVKIDTIYFLTGTKGAV